MVSGMNPWFPSSVNNLLKSYLYQVLRSRQHITRPVHSGKCWWIWVYWLVNWSLTTRLSEVSFFLGSLFESNKLGYNPKHSSNTNFPFPFLCLFECWNHLFSVHPTWHSRLWILGPEQELCSAGLNPSLTSKSSCFFQQVGKDYEQIKKETNFSLIETSRYNLQT